MPRILPLNPPFHGMSSILNVLERVGPGEPNKSTDVIIVQKLMLLVARNTNGASAGLPVPTGRFDAVTGFWIYHLQKVQTRSHPGQVVDGIVSPARGASYQG